MTRRSERQKKDKINFNRFLFVGFKLLKLLLRDIRGPWVVMGPWAYLLRVSYWPSLVSGVQYLIILTADNHAACFTWSHPTGRGSQTPTSFLQPLFGSILGRNFALSCELTGARSQKNILTWELTLFLYCLTLWWRSASSQKNAFFTNASFLEWFSANYGTWVNVCWVCASGLSELLPHYSLFFPIIDPVLFTFWKM